MTTITCSCECSEQTAKITREKNPTKQIHAPIRVIAVYKNI